MTLKTFVIVNNITNLSDARYCAGMGVDVLGFTLEPGRASSIPLQSFQDMVGWVAGVQLLGDFLQMHASEINQLAEENGLNYVLLNHDYPLPELEKISKPIILRIDLKAQQLLSDLNIVLGELTEKVNYFLLDSTELNSITEETLALLRGLSVSFPIIIGFGLSAENIIQVMDIVQPAGICLTGGNELKPGLRDFDVLADILELLQPEEE